MLCPQTFADTALAAEEQNALRALLEGLIASELADRMHRCSEMVRRMNEILGPIRTTQQIGASLRWQRKRDLDDETAHMVDLLAKQPGMRSHEETTQLRSALSGQLQAAREENPDADYAELIADVLDYKQWHDMTVFYHRGSERRKLHSRSPLSEGEKKIVTYLALFAALASSCDDLDDSPQGLPGTPRFALLDDAFAKVSADNHADLFGLLVTLDLDFIATSERLWGLHVGAFHRILARSSVHALTDTFLTTADAGSVLSSTGPASSAERGAHKLAWRRMFRCGMGVGSHPTRWWTTFPSTSQVNRPGRQSMA